MTWDDLRAAERLGMTFGPHTVTHPILSQTDDGQSQRELVTSWERLRAEAARPAPVFCYPNGMLADFTEREMRTLREQGLIGAVLGVAGYADRPRFARAPHGPYLVHRFSYADHLAQNLQYASGLERLKEILRGGRAA
jgi:peptidoglycan/xylan/chitin deacetylase (PgdA/CDA1 family)